MINKYRKKPVMIEAWQFTKTNYSQGATKFIKQSKVVELWSQFGGDVIGGEIKTLEGVMTISENDYIIKGVQGEFYPCKPDIFEMTYEGVSGHNTSCTYQWELAFLNLQDTPELRKLYWSALGKIEFDRNDQIIPPVLEDCPYCKGNQE